MDQNTGDEACRSSVGILSAGLDPVLERAAVPRQVHLPALTGGALAMTGPSIVCDTQPGQLKCCSPL